MGVLFISHYGFGMRVFGTTKKDAGKPVHPEKTSQFHIFSAKASHALSGTFTEEARRTMAIESACDSNDPEAEPNYAGPAAFGSACGRRGLALTTMPHRNGTARSWPARLLSRSLH